MSEFQLNSKFLRLAVTLTLLSGLTSFTIPSQAHDTYVVSSSGKPMFQANIYNKGETNLLGSDSSYTMIPAIRQCTLDGLQYWADMLAPGTVNTVPQVVIIQTTSRINASAYTLSMKDDKKVSDNYLAKLFQNNMPLTVLDPAAAEIPSGNICLSIITLGQFIGLDQHDGAYGFSSGLTSILPQTERTAAITPTLIHELGHALGIACLADNNGNRFDSSTNDPLSFSAHLVDINGTQAKANMPIMTPTQFKAAQAADPGLTTRDVFIIDDTYNYTYDDTGNAFFEGTHVSEVLNGATYNGVNGIPVSGWEGNPDLSHLDLPRVLMSHNNYRSYNTFTELELAVLQDLGYQIDRRNYFGCTVAGDGSNLINHNGYWARNTAGTDYLQGQYNTTPYGVGLHIFGNNNTITQAADIMTKGNGAVGIIVDGENNNLTLAEGVKVNADGTNNNGIAVIYGNRNTVTQYGTVTASGSSGTGVRFDFGTNTIGAGEYRGSYIYYLRELSSTGTISAAANKTMHSDLTGPLVSSYNLYGSLSGTSNAIYIAKNALVDQINIHDGASLNGNITSDWKHFASSDGFYDQQSTAVAGKNNEALAIQYNGQKLAYTSYVPDLVTKLNFDADLTYSGNITGSDNLKLNVKGHTLSYTGTADVVNVQVDAGAKLLGGTYTVNDMTGSMASGYSDSTTGQFINNGVMGALTPTAASDSSMSITGSLVQNGTVQFTANNKHLGYIDVTGSIVNGRGGTTSGGSGSSSGYTVTNGNGAALQVDANGTYRPNYAYTTNFVRQVNGSGQGTSGSGSASTGANLTYTNFVPYHTALLTAVYDPAASTLTFNPASNLAGGTRNQNQALNAVNNLYAQGNENTQDQLLGLYNAKGASLAGKALGQIGGEGQAAASLPSLLRTPVQKAVLSRQRELENTSFGGGMGPASAQTKPFNNNLWARLDKGWGELGNSSATYNSFDSTVGYDRACGPYWHHGLLVDYGTVTYGGGEAHADTTDWRFSLYSTYQQGQSHGFIYAGYGRQDTDFNRDLSLLGLTTKGSYDSSTWEIGGEYKYDLHRPGEKTWQVSPYLDLQAVHYKQDGYTEHGAGGLSQTVNASNETYTAGTVGLEFSRLYQGGDSLAFRAGYKKAFSGTNPKLQYRLTGNPGSPTYETDTEQDQNFWVCSLAAEKQLNRRWSLKGDVALEHGSHDKKLGASVTLKYKW